jgi:hypothetical protein
LGHWQTVDPALLHPAGININTNIANLSHLIALLLPDGARGCPSNQRRARRCSWNWQTLDTTGADASLSQTSTPTDRLLGRSVMTEHTTVVETNIYYPTDSSLLGDGVRMLTRAMKKIT